MSSKTILSVSVPGLFAGLIGLFLMAGGSLAQAPAAAPQPPVPQAPAAQPQTPTTPAAPAATNTAGAWEYKVADTSMTNRLLETFLNQQGAEGWELVSVSPKGVAIFKRPKK